MVLATTIIPDYHLVGAGAVYVVLPLLHLREDGANRRWNITIGPSRNSRQNMALR